jgi:hypothetical protein
MKIHDVDGFMKQAPSVARILARASVSRTVLSGGLDTLYGHDDNFGVDDEPFTALRPPPRRLTEPSITPIPAEESTQQDQGKPQSHDRSPRPAQL